MLRIQILISLFCLLCGYLIMLDHSSNLADFKRASSYESLSEESYSYSIGDVQIPGDILTRGILDVTGKLKSTDFDALSKKSVSIINAGKNADTKLFHDRRTFPKLLKVHLIEDAGKHLQNLASNYPDIACLTIYQDKSLTLKELECLSKFKKLTLLDLRCPVEDPIALAKYLPESLGWLAIKKTGLASSKNIESLKLPALNELRILEPLSNQFLNKLEAPYLMTLYIEERAEKGSLLHLLKFENLINLYTCDQCDITFEELFQLKNSSLPKHLQISGLEKYRDLENQINKKATPYDYELAEKRELPDCGKSIVCKIVNKSPDGFEVLADGKFGILLTKNNYKVNKDVKVFFILECFDRVLLTDDSTFFKEL